MRRSRHRTLHVILNEVKDLLKDASLTLSMTESQPYPILMQPAEAGFGL
jgi:hypothetical protein